MSKTTAFLILILAFAHAYATDEVSLIGAELFEQPACEDCIVFAGFIQVANLAYHKNVRAIYAFEDGSEQSASAAYINTDQRGQERWGFYEGIPIAQGEPQSFYIAYEVNGKTYIDDNDGLHYAITLNDFVYGESDYVELKELRRFDTGPSCPGCETVRGSIIVENLEYHKKIRVHYFAFNGAEGYVDARYSVSLGNNKELWTFEETFASSRPKVAFFEVVYDVGGVRYGDSNNEVLYGRKPYWVDAYYGNPGNAIGSTIAIAERQLGCYGCRIVTGNVELKNISYHKDVVVSYVLDNGDVIDMPTSYESGPYPTGYETWSFRGTMMIPPWESQPFSAIVTYTVDGEVYSQSVPVRTD